MKTYNVAEANTESLDNVCVVFDLFSEETDEAGNPTECRTNVAALFCAEEAMPSAEFHRARQSGICLEKEIVIDTESYRGQRFAEYDGRIYRIFRIYARKSGLTELYLEKEVGR